MSACVGHTSIFCLFSLCSTSTSSLQRPSVLTSANALCIRPSARSGPLYHSFLVTLPTYIANTTLCPFISLLLLLSSLSSSLLYFYPLFCAHSPSMMAGVNALCIRRSNALNHYSPKLIYKEQAGWLASTRSMAWLY